MTAALCAIPIILLIVTCAALAWAQYHAPMEPESERDADRWGVW